MKRFLDAVMCRSPEWSMVMKSDRDKIGLTFAEDGEFWLASSVQL